MSLQFPLPTNDEDPGVYADRLGNYYSNLVTTTHKKRNGQYFTPLNLANFIADFNQVKKKKVKLLDPGCGIGILSTILIQKLVLEQNVNDIDLIAFENDPDIFTLTEANYEYLTKWLSKKNISFSYQLLKNDFILYNSSVLEGQKISSPEFDIIISNPPYFKLSKDDIRKEVAKSVIYGQSNIYIIFMAISARLLKSNGQLIFIIPRSFCSGSYFRLFREEFLKYVNLNAIHIFDSRDKAFKKDNVLQENIILSASRNEKLSDYHVLLSSSIDLSDISKAFSKSYLISTLIDFNSEQKIIHIPLTNNDNEIIKLFKSWNGSLKKYGFEVSTGPIVDFRSTDLIKFVEDNSTIPLIWLHNVYQMQILWPNYKIKGKPKGQYLIDNELTQKRLFNKGNLILIRRFSSKDDLKRIVAAPITKDFFNNFGKIGIENHLNYVYSKTNTLSIFQTYGIAAILNSKILDLYFRTFNGNINVSATELKNLPLPALKIIEEIGREIITSIENSKQYDIDIIVNKHLNIPTF
ncbi:Eco57I restriction-modification methylase domain-containing protein [uncultured Chryseobacterium sp.]|uniref:Eco57I restriction-modification methylase domain-containing protein n=1 Tax=uncultured Chryseobacterium sp. TaxID=259322 RepID=UPI0025CB9559|nr:Eco57I restriction-modification methylase domain-containing protein [uncultured Chryseobacterium sp.]